MSKTIRIISTLAIACLLVSSLALGSDPISAQDESVYELGFLPCPDDPDSPALPAFDESKITVTLQDLADNAVGFEFANEYEDPNDPDAAIQSILFHDPFGLFVDDDNVEIDGSDGVVFEPDNQIQLDDITCPGVSLDPDNTLAYSDVGETADAAMNTKSTHAAQTAWTGFTSGKRLNIRFPPRPDTKKEIGIEDYQIGLASGQLIIALKFRFGAIFKTLILYLRCEKPEHGTYIELASFQAEKADDAMAVRWETAAEIDNAGFNISRSRSIGGPYEQINDMIGAKGNGAGASYEFIDREGQIGDFYRLEDVDYNGKRTRHLPEPAVTDSEVSGHPAFLPLLTVN